MDFICIDVKGSAEVGWDGNVRSKDSSHRNPVDDICRLIEMDLNQIHTEW
jgi:hypothetical protein